MKVIWSDQAIANLDEIVDYISAFNPDAAQRLGQRLIELGNSLGSFPNRGYTIRIPELVEGLSFFGATAEQEGQAFDKLRHAV